MLIEVRMVEMLPSPGKVKTMDSFKFQEECYIVLAKQGSRTTLVVIWYTCTVAILVSDDGTRSAN